MFYPGSATMESFRPNRNVGTHPIQKFHGCEIMPPPHRKEYNSHLYANRVCGASVDATASLHGSVALDDPVALQDAIKNIVQYIQTRRLADEANSKYHQKIMDQQQNVNKEQASTIDGLQNLVDRLQNQISELNSRNTSLCNQMAKYLEGVPMGRDMMK